MRDPRAPHLPAGASSDLPLRERHQPQLQLDLRELTMISEQVCRILRSVLSASSLATLSLANVGCSGADEPFRDCNLDTLSGTWRISYRETNGDCGPIPDETVNLASAGSGSAASTCSTQAYGISPNKCRVEQAFTCATTDGAGTTAWTMVVQQMSPTSVSGTATAQLTHRTLGTCRSTYAMTWTRL
jgi:hypothetical protein